MGYAYRQLINAPRDAVFGLCCDLRKLFRLNPQWEVLSLEHVGELCVNGRFELSVEYDRAETTVRYQGSIEELVPGIALRIKLDNAVPRSMTFRFESSGPGSTILSFEEEGGAETPAEEKRELMLWVRSIANYAQMSQRRTPAARLCTWVVDRIWLKMSPAGKRLVLLVLASEAAAFVFFILLLLWLLIFKKF